MNNRKCAQCGLVNFATEEVCRRCGAPLLERDLSAYGLEEKDQSGKPSILKRALAVLGLTALLILVFYISLLTTSDPVPFEQMQVVYNAIDILDKSGFGKETFVLRHLVKYRTTDNWWNRWVGHRDAYAATNFPFEILTLYPEFFNDAVDDTERAAILLHECYHLYGSGEAASLEGTWRNKRKLGWTEDLYGQTKVWRNTRELTLAQAPRLFQCGYDGHKDCYP
jgi:hypothetical protein